MVTLAERRVHERVDVDLRVSCRRMGRRATDPTPARAIDLSAGGLQVHVPTEGLGTGDVLMTSFSIEGIEVDCKGLVVTSRPSPTGAGRYLHVAFTGLSEASRDGLIDVLRVATS